jgi:hypothetical protein
MNLLESGRFASNLSFTLGPDLLRWWERSLGPMEFTSTSGGEGWFSVPLVGIFADRMYGIVRGAFLLRFMDLCCRCTTRVGNFHSYVVIVLTNVLPVPIYDGRGKFSLANYWTKEYKGKVEQGATVTVLFSIKQGESPGDVRGLKVGSVPIVHIHLNVLAVIVLAEPSDICSMGGDPDLGEVHGIDYLRSLPEQGAGIEKVDGDSEEGDVDNGEGEVRLMKAVTGKWSDTERI